MCVLVKCRCLFSGLWYWVSSLVLVVVFRWKMLVSSILGGSVVVLCGVWLVNGVGSVVFG